MNLGARLLDLARSIALAAAAGVLCGSASALFLGLLTEATHWRGGHRWIVFALPLAGLGLGLVYQRWGDSIKGGNNLVIDTIHGDLPRLPLRMAPMVLLGTVATHLFGGSAGREGTAVQMGASLADDLGHRLGASVVLRRELLVAGVAGGFGSVFGTPIAGAVFALELVVLGSIGYRVLVPALVASLVGDLVTRAWGVAHLDYPAAPFVELTPLLIGKWLVFAVAIAATTVVFIEATRWIKTQGERLAGLPVRMMVGGAIIVLLWQLVGSDDYLGLGIPTIERAFVDPDLPASVFALKLLFTAITLGAGFLGGEVTPLFVIGAALGSVIAGVLGIPIELGAGVGLAAVFAAAANTPLALSIMAVELLGADVLPHVVIVCVLAYALTGRRSIYAAQRFGVGKRRRPDD